MKTHYLSILIGLSLLTSCAKSPVAHLSEPIIPGKSSSDITIDDIREYLYGYKNIAPTKSGDVRVDPIVSKGETVCYLINYNDGWELLSADRRAPRVFAMCEKGNITMDELIGDNPVLSAIYENYIGNIRYLKANPDLELEEDYQNDWDDILIPDRSLGWELINTTVFYRDSTQDHLTQTQWGQTEEWSCRMPFKDNTFASRCSAGCTPVAVAQLLYFLHQTIGIPQGAFAESSTTAYIPYEGGFVTLNSNNFALDSLSYSSSVWDTMPLLWWGTGSFAAVSTLLLEVGYLFGATYRSNGTSASLGLSYNIFRDHYSIDMTTSNVIDFDLISQRIRRNLQPVMLVVSYNQQDGTRHSVLADACKDRYEVTRLTYRRLIATPVGEIMEFPYEYDYVELPEFDSRYLGINWGYENQGMTYGGSTVWFSTDAINWSAGGHTFNTIEDMYYDFHELTE